MRGKIFLIITLGFVMPYMFGLSIKVKGEEIKIPKELSIDLTFDLPPEDMGGMTTVKEQSKGQGTGKVGVESSPINDLPEPPKKISKDTVPGQEGDAEWVKPEIEIPTPEVSAPEVDIQELCST